MYPARTEGIAFRRVAGTPSLGQTAAERVPDARERIRVLVEIAAHNESSISLHEILDLLPRGPFPSTEALRDFIAADDRLSRQLSAVGEEITLRGRESLAAGRGIQRDLAEKRVAEADRFLSALSRICPWIELAGVSGSTAYRGAKPSDDVDFFLVTRRRRLWLTLLLALAAAKAVRLRAGTGPTYCFNRLAESPSCRKAFRDSRDPLFAREALSLRVLRGARFYRDLLHMAPWMAEPFPGLYASRLLESGPDGVGPESANRWLGDLLNAAAFLVLAPYLRFVGLLRNLRLRHEGRGEECFRTVVRRDFWATESAIFDALRDEYRKAFA